MAAGTAGLRNVLIYSKLKAGKIPKRENYVFE